MKNLTALIVAVTVAMFATAQSASAFNPQPDPPGKTKSQKMQKVNPASSSTKNKGVVKQNSAEQNKVK